MEKLIKQKEELSAKIQSVQKELNEARDFCKGSDEIKRLKAERSALVNDLEIHDLYDYNEEIKRIKKKLGFGNLNSAEEKKLIDKNNRLESQRTKIQRLNEVKKKVTELGKQYGPSLKKIGKLVVLVKELIVKKKSVAEKLKSAYDEIKPNNPAIKNLQLQRESIRKVNEKLRAEINVIQQEWDDKWYHYEQQLYQY